MKDFLIVGFGLAGLSVSQHLRDNNSSFDIISDQSQLSSRIAGGIINPVVVKRMKPAWQVEDYLPYAEKFYNHLNKLYNEEIYQNKTLNVFIHDVQQENNWYQANDKLRLKPFISSEVYKNTDQNINIDKLGKVKAASVNLTSLFQCLKHDYKNRWLEHTFKHPELEISDNLISYHEKTYKHVIFCEGSGITKNPYFNDLGIYGNKGDYLIIKSKELNLKDIYKAKYFLIPLGNDLYKVGATYQRQPLDHQPSEIAKAQIAKAITKMINVPYKIVDQVCGIRPTTKDRRPVVGTHQTHKNLHVLNGFGSRGVMISPKLGKSLIDHVLNNEPLDSEISIRRFDAQT